MQDAAADKSHTTPGKMSGVAGKIAAI